QYKLDLILASSTKEKKIIKQTLGYTDDEISITGLARFDNLHEIKAKKQILIMPTWRRSLSNASKNEFQKSTYFKTYKNLMENEDFHKLIEDNNIQVKFYIHNQMQKYIDCFVNEHPNIEFLDKSNSIVSDLLKESALLITDYSSVSLDFLYMNKPVLLYQFDPENNHHVPSEEIKYRNIGIIISYENELINKTEEIVNRNFKTEDEMLRNSKNIFKYRDNKNCERIFKAIHQKAYGIKGV
ncbi:CDP-glycerol glycerophosphotransferase family protein, partial [Neobacillus drentensis]|uniref:CDP-glycerol glycerophosphotransferase family protein n=1 Tax=Neobacillus drentensis TaxID=220684 RepID=UPI002FFF1780